MRLWTVLKAVSTAAAVSVSMWGPQPASAARPTYRHKAEAHRAHIVAAQKPRTAPRQQAAPVHRQAPAASAPQGMMISSPALLQDLLCLQTLANLKLTPPEFKVAALWVQASEAAYYDNPDALAMTRRAVELLEQERDAVAGHRPISETLANQLLVVRYAQSAWQEIRERYLQNAAQVLLYTLSPEQRNILAAPQPTAPQLEYARNLIQQAGLMGPDDFTAYKATLTARSPAGGAKLYDILTTARAMPPLELARRLNTLALKIAEVMAYSTQPTAYAVTDPAMGNALYLLLQHAPVREAILRAARAGAAAAGSPNSAAAPADLENALSREQDALQQQVQAIQLLSAVGFTTQQFEAAVPWFEKADRLRGPSVDTSHDIQAALQNAISRVSDDVVYNKEISLDTDGNSPDFLNAIQFQQSNVRVALQMAAFAMLNLMTRAQVTEFASADPPTQRVERILAVLNNVRDRPLSEYLNSEKSYVNQLLRKQASDLEPKVIDIFRGARLMTDAEYQARAADLAHQIFLMTRPSAPQAEAAKPAATNGGSEDAAGKYEDIQNTACARLAAFLDIPGLSTLLSSGLKK